jgi:hypothetical protein
MRSMGMVRKMKLIDYIESNKFRYKSNKKKDIDISAHKHGSAFIEAWDSMFGLMPIPEMPGRYKDE